MKYPHIVSRITSTPWAILPSSFQGIARALSADGPLPVDPEKLPANDSLQLQAVATVAVIPVSGIIGKHLSGMEIACGGCCLDDVQEAFDEALGEPTVTDIVLHFDSPGGTVPGVPELARHIRTAAAAAGKRVHAFTDTLCASAAYWLAAACDQFVCTPTATVGSIGVYVAIADYSRAYAEAGINIQLIKAGKYKDMGSDHRPLTEEEQAMIQGQVEAIHAMFRSDVSAGRPGVAASAMEGQTFMGTQAVGVGLVDELVPDFTSFLQGIVRAVAAPVAVDTPATT